jgi:hypothetical protein
MVVHIQLGIEHVITRWYIMSEFNKKYIKISIIIIIICLIIIGAMFVYANFFRKIDVSEEKTSKLKYYTCYRSKERQETCNGVSCLYSSYYKFFVVKNENGSQGISCKRYKSYKFNKDDVEKFDINTFVVENQKYEYNENNYTYYVYDDTLIEYKHDDAFSIDKQLEYLKEVGFSDCEITEE